MSLIRYLYFLGGQLLGFASATRKPGLVLLVLTTGLAVAAGLAVQFAAPVVIYPFI